jgi:hypothetical protein
MAETTYTFSISADTANGVVVGSKLASEIRGSSILVALNRVDTSGDVLDIVFKDVLDSVDDGTLIDLVGAHDGVAIPSDIKNPDGVQLVDIVFKKGHIGSASRTIVSHEYSDRTTWYQRSVRVVDEVLIEDSSGLSWSAVNANWINIYSNKFTAQYNRLQKRDGSFGKQNDYEYIIKVNDIVQTSGFSVDYINGIVTFDTSQSGNTVKATYSHNDNIAFCSEFIVKPAPGTKYGIEHVECQFSQSTVLSGAFRFEIWAGNTLAFFDGAGWVNALFDGGYGQYRMDYRNFVDFINMGNLGTGSIPVLSGHSSDICVFPFNYIKAITLKSSQLSFIRITVVGDVATTNCDLSTVTFYLEESPE